MGRASKPKTSLEERATHILQWLKSNPRLLQIAEQTRGGEPMMELCTRFATSDTTASKAFKKLLTHLEYRAKTRRTVSPCFQLVRYLAMQQHSSATTA